MDTVCKIWHYLVNLEWTEKKQENCIFCDRQNFRNIVYEDESIIAVDNHRSAGRSHWLIMPKGPATRHIRDIEALTSDDIPLLESMDRAKKQLLRDHYPDLSGSTIHCGYHRGRRHLVGPIVLPDIVSVHHLHLHVIVEPRLILRIFKYPAWFRLMWISDQRVMAQTRGRRKPRVAVRAR